ncbi:type IV pilus biogenesis protein PilM [Bacillus sp. 03113]|uniref:type IV pilus biogenesis protein PilM n=1 Tax=Bacillus sp. 03113 TaxID=2578211 RepID=UPI0011432B59|nr:pilus assembly protein PilM [Bacillus sp. 03113]
MVFSLFARKNKFINFAINDHSIRFVELKQKNPPTPLRWGERKIPEGIVRDGKIIDFETLSLILEECVDEWKIKNRSVRFIVPDPFVIIRKALIPNSIKEDELKNYLFLEFGSSIHLPFEDPVYDTVLLGQKDEKQEILIIAAPEEKVLEYQELFLHAKLNPTTADISPLALYRLYHQVNDFANDERLLIVQLDFNMLNISILENTIPSFMYHMMMDIDLDKLNMDRMSKGLDHDQNIDELDELHLQFEEMYKEISRIMDFYRYSIQKGQDSISKILLNGDHPFLDQFEIDLANQFDIPIETIHFQEMTDKERCIPRSHLLAFGLALKEV